MSSDLIRRSEDTEGSPASTFAIRDWLAGRRFARSARREILAAPTIAKACGQPIFEINVRSLLGTQPIKALARCRIC